MVKNIRYFFIVLAILFPFVVHADSLSIYPKEAVATVSKNAMISLLAQVDASNVMAMQCEVSYDPSLLEIVNVNLGGAVSQWQLMANTQEPGRAKIGLFSTASLGSGKSLQVLTVSFKSKDNLPKNKKSIKTKVTLSNVLFNDQVLADKQVKSGMIRVKL